MKIIGSGSNRVEFYVDHDQEDDTDDFSWEEGAVLSVYPDESKTRVEFNFFSKWNMKTAPGMLRELATALENEMKSRPDCGQIEW